MFVYLAILMFVGTTQCNPVPLVNCPSTAISGTTSKVVVEPCPTLPCNFKKGNNASISITFTTAGTSKDLSVYIKGKLGPAWVKLDTPKEACDDKQVICPIKAQTQYTFTRVIQISAYWPSIEVVVSVELKDDNDSDIVCVEIPVQLVP